MYIREGITDDVIQRKGVLENITLPLKRVCIGETKTLDGVGVIIDTGSRGLKFCEGKHAIVISNEFGVREPVESTVFVAGKELVIDIQKGIIYVREGGKVYGIHKDLTVTEADNKGIKWLEQSDVLSVVKQMVGASFHLKCSNRVDAYISNLMFTLQMEHKKVQKKEKTDAGYMYRMKVKEYLSDIGLEQFEYTIEEDEKQVQADEETRQRELKEEELERQAQEREERELREVEARGRELEARYASIKQGDEYTVDVVTVEDINAALEMVGDV